MSTFKCKDCKALIVHDTSPLEFEIIEKQKQTKTQQKQNNINSKAHKDNLQKYQIKSQIKISEQSATTPEKELDLESFLKGFL